MKTTVGNQQVDQLRQAIAAIQSSTLSKQAKERGLVPLRKALAREQKLCAQGR